MTDRHLHKLVHQFKLAILAAFDDQCFSNDIVFRRFPHGCCGDTSCLLAEYLRLNGIETVYVCGSDKGQSHAWLVVNDGTINKSPPQVFDLPAHIKAILVSYGGDESFDSSGDARYEESDLINGMILDITADQFDQPPVYIGYMDEFHSRFAFQFAHDCEGVGDNSRLCGLYRTIMRYIV